MNKTSYTSAESFPWKVLRQASSCVGNGHILPVHAQFIPTNRCNRNCPMCSCAKRDKTLEMSLDDASEIIANLAHLGCKAVTITGGGEPLLYPHFAAIVSKFDYYEIKLGMATNGLLLHTIPAGTLSKFTWIRISNDDSRRFSQEYIKGLSKVVTLTPEVDWAFSHVVGCNPNITAIADIVMFANEHQCTHVRLVPDLFDVQNVALSDVKESLCEYSIPDDRVIYQNRDKPTQGSDCRIGYLKPLIGPDCKVYACCGVQYALDPPSYDLPEALCIGDAMKLDELYGESQPPLDGRQCKVCYYEGYNEALQKLTEPVDHEEFV